MEEGEKGRNEGEEGRKEGQEGGEEEPPLHCLGSHPPPHSGNTPRRL